MGGQPHVTRMNDVIYILVTVAFFAVAGWYAVSCEKL
ncbi:MAG: hypothetical protein JWQ04_759 [Pedosphaera sp.]|nr:hypothetical protein [Pedosphaera sp.]